MTAKPRKLALERPDMRAHVLRAALLAIEEVGPARVRVQDIADRAGMSTGHVLYYFGRRDRVIIETLLMSEQELIARCRAELAGIEDPEAAVARYVTVYLPDGHDDIRWRLWSQVMAAPPADEETLLKLKEGLASWHAILAGLVETGVAAGVFVPLDDPAFVAMRACRMMDGLGTDLMIGIPGHGTAWAVEAALAALRRDLLPPGTGS
ncbi:TetR/AcrR family transcriptional regulator [Actinocorallia longicatena]